MASEPQELSAKEVTHNWDELPADVRYAVRAKLRRSDWVGLDGKISYAYATVAYWAIEAYRASLVILETASKLPRADEDLEAGFEDWLEAEHISRTERADWSLTAREIGIARSAWVAARKFKGGQQ